MAFFPILKDIKKLIVPYKSPYKKIGMFGQGDGYVIADIPFDICYSYGSNDDIAFENAIYEKYKAHSYTYDHTIQKITNKPFYINFKREGISHLKTKDCNTLASHLSENGHNDNNMLLKMDVEGWEWNVITGDNGSLQKFKQIEIELHFNEEILEICLKCIRKLTENFKIIHMHPNHYPINPFLDIEFPRVIELTLLRNDQFTTEPEIDYESEFPGTLDIPHAIPFPRLQWWKRQYDALPGQLLSDVINK